MTNKASSARGKGFSAKSFLMQYAIYLVLLCGIVVIIALEPSFLSIRNITSILQQSSTRLIIALGVAGIIILGGTDLSAGRMVGMAGVICASLLQSPDYSLRIYPNLHLPIFVPLLIAIVCCLFFSVIHSFLVSTLRIAPFVASLGMQMMIFGSLSLYFEGANNSSPIGGLDSAFTTIAQGSFYIGSVRVPYICLCAIAVTIIFWIIWNRTTLGRNMFAVGGNQEAARISGVSVPGVMVLVYILAGLAYAFAGFLDAGRGKYAVSSDYATKVVPVITVGDGSYAGAAQVSGPHAQVEKCKAALLIEASFFGSFRAKALIPIDKVDITDVNRVQGVGVSAQIDVKL